MLLTVLGVSHPALLVWWCGAVSAMARTKGGRGCHSGASSKPVPGADAPLLPTSPSYTTGFIFSSEPILFLGFPSELLIFSPFIIHSAGLYKLWPCLYSGKSCGGPLEAEDLRVGAGDES